MDEIRKQLREAEDRVRRLREERSRLSKIFKAAQAAVAESEGEATIAAALSTKEALRETERQIEGAQDDQVDLLRRLGDAEAGGGRVAFSGVKGWAEAARRLDLAHGETRVDLAGGSLLQRPMAAVDVGGLIGSGAAVARIPAQAPPRDYRFAYPALRQQPVDAGDLAVGGVTIDFTETALTGIERAPLSTDPKAVLGAEVGWESKDLRQFAVTVDEVPVKVLEAEDQLRALLESEMRHRLDLALDAHTMAAIQAATPPSGSTGTGLIAKVRNALAASRALGANPSVLLLNPGDAAALDLSTTGADDAYVFATKASGSAAPIWGLAIRESESVTDPTLLDPAILGPLFVGTGSVLVDPYSSMERNVVRIRVEIEALAFVQDARGAYVIE